MNSSDLWIYIYYDILFHHIPHGKFMPEAQAEGHEWIQTI